MCHSMGTFWRMKESSAAIIIQKYVHHENIFSSGYSNPVAVSVGSFNTLTYLSSKVYTFLFIHEDF